MIVFSKVDLPDRLPPNWKDRFSAWAASVTGSYIYKAGEDLEAGRKVYANHESLALHAPKYSWKERLIRLFKPYYHEWLPLGYAGDDYKKGQLFMPVPYWIAQSD